MKPFLGLCGFFFLLLWGGPAQAGEVIRFWQFWPEDWLQEPLAQFEAETGHKVVLERLTWGDGFNKIVTALAAAEAPDIIELGSTWVAGFSGQGGIQPLEVEDLKPKLNLWRPTSFQGRTYAVPWTLSTGALFINQDLLEQTGLPPPTDWKQLKEVSEAMQGLGPGIKGFGLKTGSYTTWQKFLPFVWSNGANLLEQGQPKPTDPAFLQALEFYASLVPSSLLDDNLMVRKAFAQGKLGMMLDEPGQIAQFLKERPELRILVMPQPKSPYTGKSIAFAGGQMLAVTKDAKNKEAAQALIRFLVRPEVVQQITQRITTLFPAYKGAALDPFYQQKHPELLVFLTALETATSPEAHPFWIAIQEAFSLQLERVLYGLATPKEAMDLALRDMLFGLNSNKPASASAIDPLTLPWGWILGTPLGLWVLITGLRMRRDWARSPLRRGYLLRQWRYQWNTFLFLAPWLFVFLTFSLYPIAYSFFMSLTWYPAASNEVPLWVGWSNYMELLWDPHFLQAMKNSLIFVAGTVPVILMLALFLAVVLNGNLALRNFYRASYFMPVVASVMVIATLFFELYAPQGLLNGFLGMIGLGPVPWLKDPAWALSSVMLMNIWASFGFYALMLLAGLQAIPEEYYEASSLEGAGKLRQFFTITLPLLKPTLIVAAVMDVILAFQVFGEILLLTRGGPMRTSETAVYFLYETAFHKQRMGYGSAAAYYVFLVLLLFSLGQFWLGREKKSKE